MKCFVTGASGFIGANLVHELLRRGNSVKALLRSGSDLRGLKGADFERINGNVSSRGPLVAAMRGCDWCFHTAASYHLWLPDYAPMYAANVEGTRNVIEAAVDAGCGRIVYTSTVGCIGLPQGDDGIVAPTDETAPVSETQMSSHYKMSKWRAEAIARELAVRGAPIVIVNPSAPVGPRDVKPTPTGQVIVDFLNRKIPAYLDTGLNWVHVRDVAIGHILAAEKGRVGERYILGHAQGELDDAADVRRARSHHRRARAERSDPVLLGVDCGARERSGLQIHRQKSQSATRRRAHGEIQDVVQPGQSDS